MTDETGSSGPTSRSNHAVAVTMVAFLLAVLGFAIWQNPRQQADAPGPDPDDIAIAPTEAVDSADETPAAAVQGVDEAVAEQVATAIPDTAALPESGASGEEMQEEAGTAVEVSEAESTTEPVDTEARMDEPGEDISDVSEADAGVTPAVDGDGASAVVETQETENVVAAVPTEEGADAPASTPTEGAVVADEATEDSDPADPAVSAEVGDTGGDSTALGAGAEVAEADDASDMTEVAAADSEVAAAEAEVKDTPDAASTVVEDSPAEAVDAANIATDEGGAEQELALLLPDAGARPDAATPERPPETVDQTAPSAPRFDIVRIDETGAGLVAGRGTPGSVVRVMSGGTELATAEVQASGEFVAFIQTPDSDEGAALSLVALQGSTESPGAEDLLILPVGTQDDQPVAPAVVSQDDSSVRVLQPSGLGKVDGVTLDSISYDESGAVRLSGRAPGALPIRIYVDGTASGVTQSADDGTWTTAISGIAEGRYVLRVDAINTDGSVSSRAESPFQRVFPTAEQRANPTQVTVQPGNTLWVMARDRYGQGILYTQIFAANQDAIRDPDLIYPGQIFTLPEEQDFTR